MKKSLKLFFRTLGFDAHRFTPFNSNEAQLLMALRHVEINLVFDIGANSGQFGSCLRSAGYRGGIVSFEPLTEARKHLAIAARGDLNWAIHEQCAIGDIDGDITINISHNSVSSSILPMLAAHSIAATDSVYVATESVKVARLDMLSGTYVKNDTNLFIKIDTQGYEWKVMDGAEKILSKAKGVLCELSLVHLYEGQHLWLDVISRLEAKGFILWALQKGFTDPISGRTLQMDAIFLKQ